MTEQEAIALADKRERHKAPGLMNKRWAAQHNSVKGWHVALIDNLPAIHDEAKFRAFAASRAGDLNALYEAAGDILMARVRMTLGSPTHD